MYDNSSFAEGFIAGQNGNNNGCCNGNGMFGGAWEGIWGIIILAMVFGWGNGGWGNGGFGGNNGAANFIPYAIGANGAVTRSDLCAEFNFNNLESAVRGVQQGLCDGFYAVNTSLLNGFNGVGNAICNLGYENAQLANATQMAIMQGNNALQAQLAQCCCDNRVGQMQIANQMQSCCCETQRLLERGFADTNYNMATNTCAITTQMANNTRDIIDSQNAGTRAILDYLCQEKISDLQNENQALRLSASQAAQNLAIGARIDAATAEILRKTGAECPMPAYVVQPPAPVTFPTNCCGQTNFAGFGNNNCGCGCGCN